MKFNKKLTVFTLCLIMLTLLNGCGWQNIFRKMNEKDLEMMTAWSEFRDWCQQETANLNYLVGSTKQEIQEKFGKPNKIERNREFAYKSNVFVAEEVWTYSIKDKTALYTSYHITFAFENEIVRGVVVY
jgi:outer membrane lipoprotein-sorting protein